MSQYKPPVVKRVKEKTFFDVLKKTAAPRVSFDIETSPGPEELLKKFFQERVDEGEVALPEEPGNFDPAAVQAPKNWKDPKKIAEYLSRAAAEHAAKKNGFKAEYNQAYDAAWESFLDNAPLSEIYGMVCAIGYGIEVREELLVYLDIDQHKSDEEGIIRRLWEIVNLIRYRSGRLIHHNGHGFDLPFCVNRSYVYRIMPPQLRTKYRSFEDFSVDLLDVWKQGRYRMQGPSKLDAIAKVLGVAAKATADDGSKITGDQFWKMLREGQLALAKTYLESDIVATHECGKVFKI